MNWKVVDRFPNYEVSDEGQVRNRTTGYELHGKENRQNGYLQLTLYNNGVKETVAIHVLVAHAFVDGYEEGLEVDHDDRNKLNNRASNLKWRTHIQNTRNQDRCRRVLNEDTGDVFSSLAEAGDWLVAMKLSKNLNSAKASLCACVNGKTNSCGKFRWRYLDD